MPRKGSKVFRKIQRCNLLFVPQLDRLSVRRGRVRDAAPELRCCGGGAPSGDAQGRCRALFCGIRRSAVSKLPEKVYFWSSEASQDALDAGFRPCQSLPTPSPIRSAGHSSGGVSLRRGIPPADFALDRNVGERCSERRGATRVRQGGGASAAGPVCPSPVCRRSVPVCAGPSRSRERWRRSKM